MAVRLPWSAETLHVVINHTLTNGMVLKQHMLAMYSVKKNIKDKSSFLSK